MAEELPKHRLQKARAEAGFETPTEAARRIKGLNKNTLISHENGNRPISRKAAERYANLFGRNPGWYLYGEAAPAEITAANDVEIPVLSMVAAGRLREQEAVLPTDINRVIRLNDLPKGEWIALTVDGESMNRIAPHGSLILVNRADASLVDGRYYVFSLSGGEATFKRFRRSPDRMQPFSTDPDFTSIPVDDAEDLYVFGRVRKIIQDV